MRGKAASSFFISVIVGITPACAGKSGFSQGGSYGYRDHPRVCGEKESNFGVFDCIVGSPPRVRGKVHKPKADTIELGITPACAGKSQEAEQQKQ